METGEKDSKLQAETLSKRRFHRKSPKVEPDTSYEDTNLPRKRRTASLSLLYPPPRPPLSIVKPTPKIELDDSKLEGEVPARQKHCKCKQSSCVKMYCWCFASGKYCNGCCCSNCQNNVENEEIRQDALGLILQRNQKAFRKMIISSTEFSQDCKDEGKDALVLIKHIGCCCKRSHCIQGYCECYQANIICSESCKCINCKNFKRCAEMSSKELKKLKDEEKFIVTSRKSRLNFTLAQSWPIIRRAAPRPLNFRFRSLLADIIQMQNLTEFCQLLVVMSEAVKANSDKRNPPNLENLIHEQTVKNSVQIENQDQLPQKQAPRPGNQSSAVQVDMIYEDCTSDAAVQKERGTSTGTLALMSEKKDLFHLDASSDGTLSCGSNSDIYVKQEKLILAKFRDFLYSLINHGNTKESELSATVKGENGREKVCHKFVF